jgi:hypothetical protein
MMNPRLGAWLALAIGVGVAAISGYQLTSGGGDVPAGVSLAIGLALVLLSAVVLVRLRHRS